MDHCEAEQRALRAVECLYIQVPESVADDVKRLVTAALAAKDEEIAKLKAQLAMRIDIAEHVAEELKGLGVDTGNSWDYARAAKEMIETLTARVAELEAALRPFAECTRVGDERIKDACKQLLFDAVPSDFYRAAEAMKANPS